MPMSNQSEKTKFVSTLDRRVPLMIFCALNLVLGVASFLFGVVMLAKPTAVFGAVARSNAGFMLALGVIFLLFGIVRIANAGYHIRRISRLPK